jgi:hypothetical protein
MREHLRTTKAITDGHTVNMEAMQIADPLRPAGPLADGQGRRAVPTLRRGLQHVIFFWNLVQRFPDKDLSNDMIRPL